MRVAVSKKGNIGKEKIQVSNLNMIGILNLKDGERNERL